MLISFIISLFRKRVCHKGYPSIDSILLRRCFGHFLEHSLLILCYLSLKTNLKARLRSNIHVEENPLLLPQLLLEILVCQLSVIKHLFDSIFAIISVMETKILFRVNHILYNIIVVKQCVSLLCMMINFPFTSELLLLTTFELTVFGLAGIILII